MQGFAGSRFPRRFVAGLLLAAVAGAGIAAAAEVELNDIHSRLNATHVHEVAQPQTSREVAELVARAARENLAVSISGGRHAMGGQQFAAGALQIDMSQMNRVLMLDPARGVVTVQAGMSWPTLMAALAVMQPKDPVPWSIVQKQTGADDLSIGGALSANAHGRGLDRQPLVADIEGFRIVTADGHERYVSRTVQPELFRMAVGGYGLFGVVTSVDLRLQRRMKLQRDVKEIQLGEVIPLVAQRIQDGYVYGDFQFKTDDKAEDFMTAGVFSTYKPVPLKTPIAPEQKSLSADNWKKLFALAHLDKGRAYRMYRDYYLGTDGQVYWSDTHQLSYYTPDFESALRQAAPQYPDGSLMITEVYVPHAELVPFLRQMAQDFREHRTNLIYGTVRFIRRDEDTFLKWARQDYACIVMNLRVTHSPEGLKTAQEEFQRIIDRALAVDGSYYLTYHRWARKDQVLKAYPQFVEFLKRKREFDPQERFQSEWYRYYKAMFADELRAQ